jgi:hypothetical protein
MEIIIKLKEQEKRLNHEKYGPDNLNSEVRTDWNEGRVSGANGVDIN